MAYNVAGLGAYTEQNAQSLIYKQITGFMSAKYFTIQPGIKSAETINIVASSPVFQAGGTCGFTASGTTTFSQRTITVSKAKVQLKWCEKDLEPYYLQKALKAGSQSYDTLTFEQDIIADVIQQINNQMEICAWQGDTTSGDAAKSRADGFLKLIAPAGVAISGVTTASLSSSTSWSVANSRAVVQNIWASVTNDMLIHDDLTLFMGLAELRDYKMKLGIDNLYHYDGTAGKDGKGEASVGYIENTNIKIVGVAGLSGTKQFILTPASNLYMGTDLTNEYEKFTLFYAKEADEIRLNSEFKFGFQVAFPSLIVYSRNP